MLEAAQPDSNAPHRGEITAREAGQNIRVDGVATPPMNQMIFIGDKLTRYFNVPLIETDGGKIKGMTRKGEKSFDFADGVPPMVQAWAIKLWSFFGSSGTVYKTLFQSAKTLGKPFEKKVCHSPDNVYYNTHL